MYKLKNKKIEKARGITLIALVITIIVLLILAGVSIAMLTGPNGLLSQADEARTETDMAGARDKVQLEVAGSYGTDGNIALDKLNDNLLNIPGIKKYIKDGEDTELTKENQIEGLPAEVVVDGYSFEITKEGEVKDIGTVTPPPPAGDEVTPGVIVEGSNKTYTDGKDTAVIPVGFAVSEKAEEQVIEDGLVIKDADGNEFVWIPVVDASSYVRNPDYASGHTFADDTDYLPDGITSESENVTTAKGFYISRYEAGDGSATIAKTERTKNSGTTGELVSKKDAYVYNYIKQTEAKEKAKKFTGEDNENVKSGLCTGIQWDMVMAFVNGKNDGAEPPQKFDVTTSSNSRHLESLAISGQNEADRVCNIYDLEGNFYEYVAEKSDDTINPYVYRGEGYDSSMYSASHRGGSDGWGFSTFSFRFVLYIM